MPDVSIIIVNWNSGDLLKGCLSSLGRATGRFTHETIVVDNNSTDGSPACAMQLEGVQLIRNSENRGFAAANNQAVALAAGRYLLLLNPDTVARPLSIERLVEFMDRQPEAGACGPRLVSSDGRLQRSCSHFPTLYNSAMEALGLCLLFPSMRWFGRPRMTYWKHDSVASVDSLCGACILVRRTALEQGSLLDERFFMYYEDTDLCLRLRRAGWTLYFVPVSEVLHLGGQCSLKNLDVRIVSRYNSLMVFYRKHYPRWQGYVLRCLLVVEMTWRSVLLFIVGVPSLRRKRKGEVWSRYLRVVSQCVKAPGGQSSVG